MGVQKLMIINMRDAIKLRGYRYSNVDELNSIFDETYKGNELRESQANIYKIYDYSNNIFYYCTDEGLFLDHESEIVIIPAGDYWMTSWVQFNEVSDSLCFTNYRISHDHFFFYEVFNNKTDTSNLYVLLKNNCLNLNRLKKIKESHELKRRYYERFINNSEYYYIWEMIDYNECEILTESALLEKTNCLKQVYFFWDCHPDFKTLKKMGQTDIYQMDYKKLIYHYKNKDLPEDLYIFDSSLNWTIMFAHEKINGYSEKQLIIGEII